MIYRAFGFSRFVAACAFALASLDAGQAVAQSQCEYPACVNGHYHADDGYCYGDPQPITNAMDHWQALCQAGDSLDQPSGVCHKANCGGECVENSLCPNGESYSTGGTDAQGPYGDCTTRPGFGGVISHEMVHCDRGSTLDTARGVCRRCPLNSRNLLKPTRILALRLPDLTFSKTWLSSPAGAPISTVPRGRPYLACFTVANIGTAASGVFRVSGGGLGMVTNPYQDQAGLPPGASRDGCLVYRTAPPSGPYKLGLTADSLHAVSESNEGNNEGIIMVTVTY